MYGGNVVGFVVGLPLLAVSVPAIVTVPAGVPGLCDVVFEFLWTTVVAPPPTHAFSEPGPGLASPTTLFTFRLAMLPADDNVNDTPASAVPANVEPVCPCEMV